MRSSAVPRSPRRRKAETSQSWMAELGPLQAELRHGARVTPSQLVELAGQWQSRIPNSAQETETLVLVDDTGCAYEPELCAPRWLCHLLALRHVAVHVLLLWESPRLGPVFICQMRSWTKKDFPGHVDISVGGHAIGATAPAESALIEMQEELGLGPDDLQTPGLQRIGGYECFISVDDKQFYDVEWREVYLGRVNNIDRLRFIDGEVAGVYLCPLQHARGLLKQNSMSVANGLRMSLPLCLDVLEKRE
ncbi:NUDIX domain-containing protein [Planctomycetota bacterium]